MSPRQCDSEKESTLISPAWQSLPAGGTCESCGKRAVHLSGGFKETCGFGGVSHPLRILGCEMVA